tara:strand:+ start:2429 stop:3109 length:681 start_codon:yes stop_codon:yes gene_type:complete
MTFPTGLFPRDREKALTSFEFIDIASGSAVTNFYGGMKLNDGLTPTYVLSNGTFWSDYVATGVKSTSTTFGVRQELNFDATFDKPLRIEGEIVMNIPYAQQRDGAPETMLSFPECRLFHLDADSNETQIGNTVSGATLSGHSTQKQHNACMSVTAPLTGFKAGEGLRLEIKNYGKTTLGTGYYFIGHDPKQRTAATGEELVDTASATWSATDPSQLILKVPIKLDI